MVEKYIIDKSDIHKLLTGQDIALDKGSKARAFFVEIQGNPTNGDMIKAMFPNLKIEYTETDEQTNKPRYVKLIDGDTIITKMLADRWNAPYKPTRILGYADQSGLEYADMPTV